MDFLLHHMVRTSAARFPDKEALVSGARRLCYGEVRARSAGIGVGLSRAGVRRGDRVGIFLDPSVEQVLSIFGVSHAAGVFVPINGLLFPDQVAHIARDCGMTALITSGSRLSTLSGALKDVPSLQLAAVVDDGTLVDSHLPCHAFESWSGNPAPEGGTDLSIDKDLAAILYTSGSTGKPKGVMLSHAQIMAGSSIVSTYLQITDADRILAILPFSFDAGLNQLMTAFQQGGTLVMMTFVFGREIVQMLARERITGLAGVPTLWSLLSQPSSALSRTPLPHLRYVTNTGGAMPQDVLAALRAALRSTRIVLMYGLTEAFRSTYLPPEELDRRPTSIGKAIPNTEILVVDEHGRPCGPGEVGELVHRGPTVSLGYWGHPELTASVLRSHPFIPAHLGGDEKVCYSGDLVRTDEDGFLYFVGRRDAMIKSSGFRISSTEIEEVLFSSGKLKGAAVIGIPDPVLGQAIKAFVVPKEGQSADAGELLELCAARMPRYMVPGSVEVVDSLPTTPSGKVDYPALRRRESRA
jgi:acyl-CoA ligase (AMP-forming) (exosortase A-associated)